MQYTPNSNMNTPKAKGVPVSLSKYLTPCRTTGLKRKSFSPLSANSLSGSKLVGHNSTKRTPLRQLPTYKKCEGTPCKPSEEPVCDDTKNRTLLENSVKPLGKPCISSFHSKSIVDTPPTSEKNEDQQPFFGFSCTQDIIELIKNINLLGDEFKQKREQSDVYRKQHNLSELQETTKVWKSTFQEVVLEIQETLKSRGNEVTLANILKENGIPFEDANFNRETMDFE